MSYTFTRPAVSGTWTQTFNVPKGNWLFIGNCDLSGTSGSQDAQFNVPILGSHYWCCDSAGGDESRESQGIGVISADTDTTEYFSVWTNVSISGAVYINLIRLR